MPTPVFGVARALEELRFSHMMLLRLVDATPAEHAAFQAFPADNHLLWLLGHLALEYRWFAAAIDGRPDAITARQHDLFDMGTRALPDASLYPTLGDLRSDLDAAWSRLERAGGALTDEDAGKAPASGVTDLKDRLDALTKCAWHTGWHTGQLAGLRRALGLKGAW